MTVDLDIIRHPGAAAIVPLTEKGTLLMIRQYRHSVGEFIWEIPAGTLDPGEDPLECARRELVEETGFEAEAWEEIGEITPLPGYSDERIHIFLATGLRPGSQDLDNDEILQVHEVDIEKAFQMFETGEIKDGKTISGLLMAGRRIRGKDGEHEP